MTDGLIAYTFYHYEEDGMNFRTGPQHIGLLYDGLADGIDDNKARRFLARPNLNLVSGSKHEK